MTGTEPFIEPAIEGLKWGGAKGWKLLKSWWLGKELLVVGQARAGKTTFIEYLQFGLFDDYKPTEETDDIRETTRFNLGIGRKSALELFVSRAIDSPGQVGAVAHANYAFERNPDGLIIVLDLTTPLDGEPDRASGSWLRRFCRRYEAMWRANRKRKNRLRSLTIVMNKADLVELETINKARARYREIVDADLRDARGTMTEAIAVLSCVTVTNPAGTKPVDSVLAHIAKAFARK